MTQVSVRIKATDIRKKLHEQKARCAYTGDELTPENVTADHVVPLSRGGEHNLANIQLCTDAANRAKGTMLLEEFVELCRKVVAHADHQARAERRELQLAGA